MNCLLKPVIEDNVEGMFIVSRRWGKRIKQLFDDSMGIR
jgi:hypothetical protein